MKCFILSITLVVAFLGLPDTTAGRNTQQYCRGDTTVDQAAVLVRKARQMATDTDAPWGIARDSALNISLLTESAVQLVSNESICQQAAAAYEAVVPRSGLTHVRRVYVITLGSDYLVIDPEQKFGEFITAIVLNSAFVQKSFGHLSM